jgi:hypothetical protein
MAGPLEDSCGFGSGLSKLIEQNDGIFVVGNSAALAKAAWTYLRKPGDPPLLGRSASVEDSELPSSGDQQLATGFLALLTCKSLFINSLIIAHAK